MSRSTPVRVVLVALAMLALAPAAHAAPSPSLTEYVTNGIVDDGAVDALGRRYIAGAFTMVGPRTGHGLALTTTNDQTRSSFPDIAGTVVRATVADGSGGWYVGGTFTAAGGVPRLNLAHILADGSVDPAFDPGANGTVSTITRIGGDLYVGGQFTWIDGAPRTGVAKLSSTGAVDASWDAGLPAGTVSALAATGGGLVIGGSFTTAGGQTRNRIAQLSFTTGLATAWNPNADGTVGALAVSGSTVIAGGGFSTIGGQARGRIAQLDLSTGVASAWNPGANGVVLALTVSGNAVYAGGQFTTIGGTARPRLAKLYLDSNTAAQAFNGTVDNAVRSLHVDGSTVYIGGLFKTVGGVPRWHVARVDATTAAPDPGWNPNASGPVWVIARDGTDVLVGGEFATAGASARPAPGLARLNADGTLDTTWTPPAGNQPPNAVALTDDGVFVGGYFTAIDGQPQRGVAKLSPTTGAVLPWNPQIADGAVLDLQIAGGKVYLAGSFTTVGGVTHNKLVRADVAGSGAIDAGFAPPAGPVGVEPGYVSSVTVAGGFVYYAGQFSVSDPNVAVHVARASVADGSYDASWTPAITGGYGAGAYVLRVRGDLVYLGGSFTGRLVRVSATTGAVDGGWTPNPDGDVDAFVIDRRGGLIAAGAFTAIGGSSRGLLARLNPDGTLDPTWDPQPDAMPGAVYASGARIFLGGTFKDLGGLSTTGHAQVLLPSGTLRLVTAGDAGTFAFTADDLRLPAGSHPLEPGTYAVTQTGANLSAYSVRHECRDDDGAGAIVASGAGAGPLNVTLGLGDQVRCVFTNTVVPPPPGPTPTPTPDPTPEPPVTPQPPAPTPTPVPPVSTPTSGTITGTRTTGRVTINGKTPFRTGSTITKTTVVDATKGSIDLTVDGARLTISRGAFTIERGKTITVRTHGKGCARRLLQVAATAGVTVQGRASSSTAAAGTARWLTTDRCDGTLTKVAAGHVRVRDAKRGKTVTVKAGAQRFVALRSPAKR